VCAGWHAGHCADALPGRAAVGYLDASTGSRTNVFHLPVVVSGDGGIYTTVSNQPGELHLFLWAPGHPGGRGASAVGVADGCASRS
jgi:hypothetical protein